MKITFNRSVYLGIIVMLIAIVIAVKQVVFIVKTVSAKGVVVELIHNIDASGMVDIVVAPRVRFKTVAGQGHFFVSSYYSYPPAYEVGESVTVLYPKNRPYEAKLKGFFSLWGFSAIVFCIGLGCCYMSIENKAHGG